VSGRESESLQFFYTLREQTFLPMSASGLYSKKIAEIKPFREQSGIISTGVNRLGAEKYYFFVNLL
jgi:hypothetical protein